MIDALWDEETGVIRVARAEDGAVLWAHGWYGRDPRTRGAPGATAPTAVREHAVLMPCEAFWLSVLAEPPLLVRDGAAPLPAGVAHAARNVAGVAKQLLVCHVAPLPPPAAPWSRAALDAARVDMTLLARWDPDADRIPDPQQQH